MRGAGEPANGRQGRGEGVGGQVGACERAPPSIGEEERKGFRGVWGKGFWSGRNAQQKNL